METAFSYVINKKGINSAVEYPYKANDVFKCKYSKKNSVGTITSFALIETGNETILMNVVALVGPLSIAVYGSLETFQSYKSGVYYDPACTININHAVLLSKIDVIFIFLCYQNINMFQLVMELLKKVLNIGLSKTHLD